MVTSTTIYVYEILPFSIVTFLNFATIWLPWLHLATWHYSDNKDFVALTVFLHISIFETIVTSYTEFIPTVTDERIL